MKRIMIDMDDVICDAGEGFLTIVNEFLNTNYKYEDVKGYYIQDLVPEEKREEWRDFFYQKNIYDYTKVIPGAYEVLEKLNQKYEIYILTTYIFKDYPNVSSNHLKNKFIYLCKEFPFINPERFIFTSNKEILNCDIRIDDRADNLKGDD